MWAMKAANGLRTNFNVPFGYIRDPEDQEKWLIDEPAAEVVRKIFTLCLAGKGPDQIARQLEREKVLTPSAYYHALGSKKANHPMPKNPYRWKDSSVCGILANRSYTGCTVKLKTTTVSYKVHKMVYKRRTSGSSHPTRRRLSLMRIPGSAFRNSGKTSAARLQQEGQVCSPGWSIVLTAARSSISAQPRACGRIRSFFDAPITNPVAVSVPSISFGT